MATISGYGRIAAVPRENTDLTHVGFGTPMGEVLRRYWQPVCLSSDIDELPKRVTILGETLVAFRDRRERVGVLDAHCCHRGTSLEFGRVEADGIRCCYHGWKYAATGQCIDMPLEPEGSTLQQDIRLKGYEAVEAGGIVFAYIGPKPAPVPPRWDLLFAETGLSVVGA